MYPTGLKVGYNGQCVRTDACKLFLGHYDVLEYTIDEKYISQFVQYCFRNRNSTGSMVNRLYMSNI